MSSSAPPQPPPVITIYRNGDRHFLGKKLVVNRRYYRSFENFLDRVTQDTRSRFAIRKIHTPSGGTRVGSLEKIKNGAIYVAAGTERFRRIQYGTENKRITSMPNLPSIVHPVSHSKITATSRYKQEAMAEPLRNRIIFVYRNGEDKSAPVKLLLDKRTLNSMNSVLQYISNKINLTSGAVKSIYLVDTCTKVIDVNEIHTNTSYIAVGSGKQLVKGRYGNNDSSNKLISPRHKAIGYANKLNKSKEMKKSDNELKRTITSLSVPDEDMLASGVAAMSVVNDQNTNRLHDLDTSHETSVNNELDVVEGILSLAFDNNIDESISQNVDTLLNKDTDEEIIKPEILSSEMSGTPPLTMLSEGDKSNIETAVEERIDLSNSIIDNDEPISNNIDNPPFTNSPVLDKGDKQIDTASNELSGMLEVSSPNNNNINEEIINHDDDINHDDNINEDIINHDDDVVSSIDNDTSVEESINAKEEQPTHDETDNDEESSKLSRQSHVEESIEESDIVTEEQSVYKASGTQKESGDHVNDDKETVVEKLIDMVPAAEVEEDLETGNEVSNFYSH